MLHQDKNSSQQTASATLDLKEILSAPLKQAAQAKVRVSDQYLSVKTPSGQTKGLLRVLMYLEDMGPISTEEVVESAPTGATDY